jgi:hypothetical protein
VSATVGMSDDPKAKLRVDVLSLKRKDKLLVLTLQVTPTHMLIGTQALFTLLRIRFWSPELIDSVNLKQYSVVKASSSLASSVTSVRATSGQPMYLYAVFAAPPAGGDQAEPDLDGLGAGARRRAAVVRASIVSVGV